MHSWLCSNKGYVPTFLAACYHDPRIWFTSTLWTFNSQALQGFRDIPFIPWPHQEKGILRIKEAIDLGTQGDPTDLFFLKSRKQGATYIILGVFLLYFIMSPQVKFLLGSRKEDLVDAGCEITKDGHVLGSEEVLFFKLLYMLNTMPDYLKPINLFKKHLLLQNLENDAAFRGDTTNIGFGKSFRATATLIDEAAQIEPSVTQWIIENLADTSQCNIFNSTKGPWGGSHPYDRMMVQQPDKTIELSFYDNPTQNVGLYESPEDGKIIIRDIEYFWKTYPGLYDHIVAGQPVELSDLPTDGYRFIADGGVVTHGLPRTVFFDQEEKRPGRTARGLAQNLLCLDSGSTDVFFSYDLLNRLKQHTLKPSYQGTIEYDILEGNIHQPRFVPGGQTSNFSWWGPLKWGRPDQTHNYAIGCDLSRGSGASNSVAAVEDVNTNEIVGILATPFLKRPAFAELVVALCEWVGGCVDPLLNWEENGADEFYEKLEELGYFSLYRREGKPNSKTKWKNAYGWCNTVGMRGTKVALLNKLDAALTEGLKANPQFECLHLYDESTINEMETYVFYEGKADVGPAINQVDKSGAMATHGDKVIGVGLAKLAAGQQPKGHGQDYVILNTESFAARKKRADEEDRRLAKDAKQWY